MRESDHGFLTRAGSIRLPTGRIEQLGVADGAVCWGLWTQGKSSPSGHAEDLCRLGKIDPVLLERFISQDPWAQADAEALRREASDGDGDPQAGIAPNLQGPHLVIAP